MKKFSALLIIIFGLSLIACDKQKQATTSTEPSNEQKKTQTSTKTTPEKKVAVTKKPVEGRTSTKNILDIVTSSPPTSEPLEVGKNYTISVDVTYTLVADEGRISILVQEPKNGVKPLAFHKQAISKGEGELTLSVDITVPETDRLVVLIPLMATGDTSTKVLSTKSYQVIKAPTTEEPNQEKLYLEKDVSKEESKEVKE